MNCYNLWMMRKEEKNTASKKKGGGISLEKNVERKLWQLLHWSRTSVFFFVLLFCVPVGYYDFLLTFLSGEEISFCFCFMFLIKWRNLDFKKYYQVTFLSNCWKGKKRCKPHSCCGCTEMNGCCFPPGFFILCLFCFAFVLFVLVAPSNFVVLCFHSSLELTIQVERRHKDTFIDCV